MVELKTPSEIDAMRAAGAVVAEALAAVRAEAAIGVRLDYLDHLARAVLDQAGATSPFRGYQPGFATSPYPGVVCLSVNDAVLPCSVTAMVCSKWAPREPSVLRGVQPSASTR